MALSSPVRSTLPPPALDDEAGKLMATDELMDALPSQGDELPAAGDVDEARPVCRGWLCRDSGGRGPAGRGRGRRPRREVLNAPRRLLASPPPALGPLSRPPHPPICTGHGLKLSVGCVRGGRPAGNARVTRVFDSKTVLTPTRAPPARQPNPAPLPLPPPQVDDAAHEEDAEAEEEEEAAAAPAPKRARATKAAPAARAGAPKLPARAARAAAADAIVAKPVSVGWREREREIGVAVLLALPTHHPPPPLPSTLSPTEARRQGHQEGGAQAQARHQEGERK